MKSSLHGKYPMNVSNQVAAETERQDTLRGRSLVHFSVPGHCVSLDECEIFGRPRLYSFSLICSFL